MTRGNLPMPSLRHSKRLAGCSRRQISPFYRPLECLKCSLEAICCSNLIDFISKTAFSPTRHGPSLAQIWLQQPNWMPSGVGQQAPVMFSDTQAGKELQAAPTAITGSSTVVLGKPLQQPKATLSVLGQQEPERPKWKEPFGGEVPV